MSMAFRHAPLRITDYQLLVLKAYHPQTGELFYFVEKCLPFGSSILCAIFQAISDSIAHLVMFRTQGFTLNYLDDYYFVDVFVQNCNEQVQQFLQVCDTIHFPVSLEKTHWVTTVLTFLGMLLDSDEQLVCIPVDKIIKAVEMIQLFLSKKKVTVHQVQKLCGFLNFLCRCVIPGHAFTRRLYALTTNKTGVELKPHHYVRLKQENKWDLELWLQFLSRPDVFCRPFADFDITEAPEKVLMYSDASRNFTKGFGAWCQHSWLQGSWDPVFMQKKQPSIEFLELFALTAGVLKWLHRFKNKKICLFCNNESCIFMIRNSSSRCKNCMVLIRLITLHCMIHNVKITADHVGTKSNGIADALSRGDMSRFKQLGKKYGLDTETQSKIPEEIWPMYKIWLD